MKINDLLDSREERNIFISKYIKDYDVICLKANIAGINKNIKETYLLIRIFHNIIINKFIIKDYIKKDSYDGYYVIYLLDKNSINIKDQLIEIENNHILGRLIDLDYYSNSNISVTRTIKRKCYLCDDYAFNCIVSKKHSSKEINTYINKLTSNYIYSYLIKLIKYSAKGELELENKFGLVTKTSSGSHADMDYKLMLKAINCISPYLIRMFKLGYNHNYDYKTLFNKAKLLGLKAEEKMYLVTNNINCYKGLIFNLGLILISLGRILKTSEELDTIFQYCSNIIDFLDPKIGAINEAKSGYSSVRFILDKYDLTNKNNYLFALIDLIVIVDDTILIKRAQDKINIRDLKEKFCLASKTKDSQLINLLNEYCLRNKLSFGGCADLLVVAILLSHLFKDLNL